MSCLVIDIGGSHIRIGDITQENAPLKIIPTPHNIELLDIILAREIKKQNVEKEPLSKIIIGFPGLINDYGQIVDSVNFKDAKDFIFKMVVSENPLTKIILLNDALLQAFAYSKISKDYVYIVYGTGIGGAFFVDGKPVRGHGNLAGEIGHCLCVDSSYICHCGRQGCIEACASGKALESKLGHRWWEREDDGVKHMMKVCATYYAELLDRINILLNPEYFFLTGRIFQNIFFYSYFIEDSRLKNMNISIESSSWHNVIQGGKIICRTN